MKSTAIGLVSKNIFKMIEFYKNLGISFEAASESGEHYEAYIRDGVKLMLDQYELIKKIDPSYVFKVGSNIAIAFEKETSSEVDEIFNKALAHDCEVVKEPWNAFWGQRYCSIKDPDGNQLDFFASLSK